MARVLGVGGVFFKSEDPENLGEWYQKWLGVPVEPPYGANFKPDTVPVGGLTVWAPFKKDTDYFDPSNRDFMFNLMVDDLDGALAQVVEGGAEIAATSWTRATAASGGSSIPKATRWSCGSRRKDSDSRMRK